MELNLQYVFLFIVLFTILQRLFELRISTQNEKSIVQDNGFIVPEKNYLFMVSLHSTWLVAILYMAIWRWSESNLSIFLIGLVLFLCGQTLRIIAIKTLGSRWTTRIAILPEKPAINKGVFKYLRHPNYLGVCLEIFALPFMASFFYVSIFFSIVNLLILYFRIKKEEEFLSKYNSYQDIFNLAEEVKT